MTFPTRSIRPILMAVLALFIGLPVTAQSPGTPTSPGDPAAAPGVWAQAVLLPNSGTQVVVGRSGLPGTSALSEPVPITVVGPQDGWLLAWWRAGGWTQVVRIDPTGRVRPLLRTPDTISAVALEPRGDRWVWATAHDDGRLAAVYRAKTTPARPGARTRIAGGSRLPATRLLWLGSADRLGVELHGDGGYRLRIHDLRTGQVTPSAFEGAQRVIGALGDELLAGTATEAGAIAAPLIAIDPTTGAARSVTTGTGSGAYETETGSFIWDETNADGSSSVRSLVAGAAIRTLATVPSDGRTMASTSGDARANDADIAAFVPAGSWLGGGDPDATIITADLLSGQVASVPAYEVLPPTGLAWMPLRVGGARDGASLWDAVEWSGGVAVLGARGLSRVAEIWRVSDETGWGSDEGPALVSTTVPAGDTAPGLLGAARGRLLAVGVSDGADPHVVLWTSTDGRRWRRVPDQPAFHVPAGQGASLGLREAATLEGRPAFVVSVCVETCERPWVLTQTGPGRWSRTAVPSGAFEVIDGYRRLLAEQEATDGTVRLIATTDGRRWGDTGTTLPHVGEHRLVDTASGPLVVATDPVTEPLTIARTDDGTTWETTFTDSHPWDVQAIAAEGDRVVIVGDVILDWERDVQVDATLTSSDGGRTWQRSLLGRAPVGSRVESVAIVGEHAIAVGGPEAWVIDLPE